MSKIKQNKEKIIPILIWIDDKKIGIEYKNGKFILFGKENMDKGVELLFLELSKYLEKWLKNENQKSFDEAKQQIKDLITEEMLICRKENTPTSRLTSLFMKINNLI